MTKRTYDIQEYTVNIDGNDETRNVIIYYDEIGIEFTREFYLEGNQILPGYVERNSVISEQQDPD